MDSTSFTRFQEGKLLVTGLKSPESVRDDFGELLLRLTAQHSCIQNVSFKSYSLTILDSLPAAQVSLSFGPFSMEVFCNSVLTPSFGDHLDKISQHGLLGYSPVTGSDFEQIWNMAVVKSMYIHGASRMEEFQLRALELCQSSKSLPMWIKVTTFVSESLLEAHLIHLNPQIDKKMLDAVKTTISDRKKARDKVPKGTWTFAKIETVAEKLLHTLANSTNSPKSEEELLYDAKFAVRRFFDAAERACTIIKDTENINTIARQRIYNELYKATEHAYEAFQTTEELMKFYTKLTRQFSGDAIALVFSTLLTTCGPKSFNAAAQAYGIKMVTSAATRVVSVGAVQTTLGVGQAAFFLRTVYCAVKVHAKEQFCKELNHLVYQVWHILDEAMRLLQLVYMTGGKFYFHEHGNRDWEKFLKDKTHKEVNLEYKSPEFVMLYLKSQVESIEAAKRMFFERNQALMGSLEEEQLGFHRHALRAVS